MTNTKILVCTHKEGFVKSNGIFMPVQGGKAVSTIDLGIQGDDTGENISHKNARYAELTVLYWAWKNQKKADYIGLCHYRRYFKFSRLPFRDVKIMPVEKFLSAKDTEFNPDKHLGKYDIILAKPFFSSYPIHFDMLLAISNYDFSLLKDIINNSFHDYYDSFCYVMDSNIFYHCNMFITKWEIFNDYSEWLFAVLDELEKVIPCSEYPPHGNNSRYIGYHGEFLLNVYVHKNKLNVKNYPVIKLADGVKSPPLWRSIIRFFTVNIAFRMGRPLEWWLRKIPR